MIKRNVSFYKVVLLVAFISFFIAWLLPHHYAPWKSAFQDSLALLFIFLLAFIVSSGSYLLPRIIIAPILLLLIIPIQSITGLLSFSGDAWAGFLYISFFVLAVVVGFQVKENNLNDILFLIKISLLLAASISSLIAIRQWLQVDLTWLELSSSNRPYANMAQPNNLSTLIMLGIVALLFFKANNKVSIPVFVLVAAVLAFALMLTKSRTPLLSLFIVPFFLFGRRNYCFPYFFFIGLLFVFYVLDSWLNAKLMLADTVVSLDRGGSNSARLMLYKQFTLAILQKPWVGYGINQIAAAQIAITPVFPLPNMMTQHTHNILLDMMVWFGIPITILVIVYALFKVKFLPSLKSNETLLYAQLSALVIFIHGMLEFPLEYAIFLMPFGLFIGLMAKSKNAIKIEAFKVKVFALMLMMAGAYTLVEYVQIEQFYAEKRITLVYPEMKVESPDKTFWFTNNLYSLAMLTEPHPKGTASEHQKITYRYPSQLNLKNYYEILVDSGDIAQAQGVMTVIEGMYGDELARRIEKEVRTNRDP